MMEQKKSTIVCVDALVIRPSESKTEILLITRKKEPSIGGFAFPGGHLEYDENPELAVLRELKEETNLEGKNLGLFTVRGQPGRDPRGHTVSIVYHIEVAKDAVPKADDDAATAKFYDIKEILAKKDSFAFDHFSILEEFVNNKLKL